MIITLLKEIRQILSRIEQHLDTPATAELVPLFQQVVDLLGAGAVDDSIGPLTPTKEQDLPETTTAPLPEHVSINWILTYLQVGRSTFYRSIKDKLLFHVQKIGNRPYYLKAHVLALMIKHEKGAWTFAKHLQNLAKTDRPKDPPDPG